MSVTKLDYNAIDWSKIFTYDPSSKTGLRWNTNIMSGDKFAIYTVRVGDEAGTIKYDRSSNTRYWIVVYKQKKYRAHRIAWILNNGYLEADKVIDHIDQNSTNNRIENLRKVEQGVNMRNSKMSKKNTSGKSGVCFQNIKNKDGTETLYVVGYYRPPGHTTNIKKAFPVKQLGLLPAFAAACAYRDQMIEELNKQGLGYSDNHGKTKKEQQ